MSQLHYLCKHSNKIHEIQVQKTDDWKTAIDPSSGKTYHHNIQTGEQSWIAPMIRPTLLISFCPIEDTFQTIVDKIEKSWKTSTMCPAETITSIVYLQNGRELTSSNISTFEWKPEEPFVVNVTPWIAILDPVSGRTYYANMKTKETRWDRPLGWKSMIIRDPEGIQ